MSAVLITGAGGQLGGTLAALAWPDGVTVVALSRSQLDIADAGAVSAVIDEVAPAVVINAAAFTNVDDAEDHPEAARAANEVGPGNLARAVAASEGALFHVSTDYVFDGTKGAPYVETDATNPLGQYARTKLAGELAVAELASRALIVRTSWVFSGSAPGFAPAILRRARTHEELKIVADQIGTPTPAAELAAQLQELTLRVVGGEELAWGVYHLGGTPAVTRFAWAEAMLDELRRATPIALKRTIPVPASAFPAKAIRPSATPLDSGRIQTTLSLEPIDWRDSVARTVAEVLAR